MSEKIGFVGYFGYNVENPIIGGQMSKTRGIYEELCKKYGSDNINIIDTANWKKEKFRLLMKCLKMGETCKVIIIMPNKNGIKIILPLFAYLKKYFNYKLVYPVVGGWLTETLQKDKSLITNLKSIDLLLPETEILKNELNEFYDGEIEVMPIFSMRNSISISDIALNYSIPFRLCTFSRVTPEKGIDIAIQAINEINSDGEIKCILDIWGPIENQYENHYKKLFKEYEAFITYKGVLKGDDCLKTLSKYFFMLFPTFYPGEGFPVSVCEAFMAGLPVLASDWRFNSEIIKNGETGYLYETNNVRALEDCIVYVMTLCRDDIYEMKKECLKYSKRFKSENVMKDLLIWIDNEL